MKKLILAATLAGSLALSGCASLLTPQRCETALSAGHSVNDFLALLRIQFPHLEPALAQKLAEGLNQSLLTLEAACSLANPVPPPSAS